MTNVTRDGWGNLAGPAFKAANVRASAPFFRDLVEHYCTSEHPRDRNLRSLVAAMDDLYIVLCNAPIFPPDATVLQVRGLCMGF